jgi:hypothetical protein
MSNRHRLILLVVVSTSMLPWAAVAQKPAQSSGGERPVEQGTHPPQKRSVAFKGGRFSVDVQGHALETVASEISDGSGVPIMLDSAVAKNLVTAKFQDLPLDEGLRQILKNCDTFFFYGAANDGPASLKVVWVYPKGTAQGMAPVPPEKWASTSELEKMLSDPNPEVRGLAVEALIEQKSLQALGAVMQALKDSDDQVRTRALYGAAKSGIDLPPDTVRSLALNDASPNVRFLALQSMANAPDVKTIAESLLNDPNEPVRLEAQEILSRLEPASQPPESDQTPQNQMQQPNY